MPEEHIQATVDEIVYRNAENGYTVLSLRREGEVFNCIGEMPAVSPGEPLEITGEWVVHHKYGRQFRASIVSQKLPRNQKEVLAYLAGGLIKGIGKQLAIKIVERFGDSTLDVMGETPGRLAEIKGISAEKAEEIGEAFAKQYGLRQAVLALEAFGMTTSECLKAYKLFGQNAPAAVTANPWSLCEIDGITIRRADQVAQRLPSPPNIKLRNEAVILDVLRHAVRDGHCGLPRKEILRCAADGIVDAEGYPDPDNAEHALDLLLSERRLLTTGAYDSLIYLPPLYIAESACAKEFRRIIDLPPAAAKLTGTFADTLAAMEQRHGITYTKKQRQAMMTILERGLLVLTGGPGTGKTTCLRGVLDLLKSAGLSPALCAPTGRAAKRMSELTGADAKTIHRLLEVEWDENSERQSFARNKQNPLSCNALIVDECSMVDIFLFAALLEAIPLGCRLVLVGDADQLPPVGPGSPFQDLVALVRGDIIAPGAEPHCGSPEEPQCGSLPVVILDYIFRQQSQSRIVENAHRILMGEYPDFDKTDGNCDMFFMERRTPLAAAELIIELVTKRLPKAYKYDPEKDIQVLCPTRKDQCGSVQLGEALRQAIRPAKAMNGKLRFQKGDKVMQLKNNYELDIYNGDIGYIEKAVPAAENYLINFPGTEEAVTYPAELQNELEQAYAITVHKSQGGEFPAVIIPLIGVPDLLIYRNLIYTAVTRAQKLLILVGLPGVLRQFIANDRKAARYSGFLPRLVASIQACA
ncbi:MAG: AAA family ATPase [Oscillospiraceae bacterium]|jgi:exodeoxyribonuclease V alpha subunit|nr:AAA family ATPase [Oscillospiraceae bacterium]